MGYYLEAKNELFALHDLLDLILKKGTANGNYLEVLSCLLTIHFDSSEWERYIQFRDEVLDIGGDITKVGWDRASRVYSSTEDRPTKPSYLKRLIAYPDRPRRCDTSQCKLNQLEKICIELAKKPGYSNLSFVILRPADLYDQFRPGYVPCAIAGDFKFRNGRLDLSVMFRTSDAFAVGYADIYYLRRIQEKILMESQMLTSKKALKNGTIGDLNLYFSRSYVERVKVFKNKKGSSSRRVKVIPLVEMLIREIEAYQL